MKGFNLKKICDIVSGTLINARDTDAEAGRIVIDTREIRKNDIFAAFRGEKVDGHDFVNSAFSSGAICCIVDHVPEKAEGALILVSSVQNAVERIAQEYRNSISVPVIGITGSNGKTTAKEMIYAVLSQKYSVLKTDKNLNNQIGVPMTVSSICDNHSAAVIEMGISKKGDMDLLGRIVRPDIAVFTNIGHAHLEFLDNLQGVYSEKTKLLKYMDRSKLVIVNGDDRLLNQIDCEQKVIRYGLGDHCDVKAYDITVAEDSGLLSFTLDCFGENVKMNAPAFGKHIIYAVLEAAAAGWSMGMSLHDIAAGIAKYQVVGSRSSIIRTDCLTVIDDCYNANPDSVKNAVDSMMLLKGRHVCILGDMLELGNDKEELHYIVGKYAAENGCDRVIACGPVSSYIVQGAGKAGVYCENLDELSACLSDELKKDDIVLVKASRSMHFERVTEVLKTLHLH